MSKNMNYDISNDQQELKRTTKQTKIEQAKQNKWQKSKKLLKKKEQIIINFIQYNIS